MQASDAQEKPKAAPVGQAGEFILCIFERLLYAFFLHSIQGRQRQPLNQGAWFVACEAQRAAACCKRPVAKEEEPIASSSPAAPADKTRRFSHVCVGTIERGSVKAC